MPKKKNLGQGIKAILGSVNDKVLSENKPALVKELTNTVAMLEIKSIEINPFQPRKEFDANALEDLSKSIKTYGLIQPITVRSLGNNVYQLISGERRFRASQKAGLTEIPAYIRLADDQEMLEMALVENIQRENLNAIEVAVSYNRLMEECNLTQDNLSKRVGKDRSTISNYIRLLSLPPSIQDALKDKTISMGHARALAGVTDIDKQLDIFRSAVDQKMSVRKLEQYIKAYGADKKDSSNNNPSFTQYSKELRAMELEMSAKLGCKISIKRDKNGKGQIVIRFAKDSELNDIYDRMLEG